MSQATYNKMWTDAQKDLDIQLQREREEFLQPEKDRVKAFKMLAVSYIKYMQIFRNLETAHDQLIHQQKRTVIRQVLDGVIGRILEMKKEMVELENSEFHYIDNILEDLKLLPKPVKAMTLEEAVKMIQVAERARQGRCRAAFMKQIYLEEKRAGQTKHEVQMGPSPDDAATCIQKVQHPALVLAEFDDVPLCPTLQPVRVLLDGSTAFRCVNHPSQFCVISKLAEGTFHPFIQVIDEYIEQDWTPYSPLWNCP
ncbi:iq and aaa hypothetical protein [Limosa lapponica baueri]|uniref:Uncharacterized protein n=1 Tax=Limosa lapponica baueri TaxID=1758121 RepID=A0A2I0TLQ0_LIMLA|nr:iq and aaa hypothetical protein [Limosa lapponica baueri]